MSEAEFTKERAGSMSRFMSAHGSAAVRVRGARSPIVDESSTIDCSSRRVSSKLIHAPGNALKGALVET